MDNKKSKDFAGKIDDCSEEQISVLEKFKDHVKNVLGVDDPRYDDWYLLRFCRARKFKLQDVIIMFQKFMEKRQEFNSDEILKQFKKIKKASHYKYDNSESVYFCHDKMGRPVRIDKWSAWNSKNMMNNLSMRETAELFVTSIESEIHCMYPYMSMIEGRRVETSCLIHDMKDFSLSVCFDKDCRDWFGYLAGVAQDCYPEMLEKCYVVNAPFLINAAWALAKTFLNEKTRKKVQIIGSSFEKTLYKDIEKNQLPDFLGGTKVGVWPKNNHVPWKKYERKCFERESWFNSKDKKDIVSDPLIRSKMIREELKNEEKLILPLGHEYKDQTPNLVVSQLSEQLFNFKDIERESRAYKKDSRGAEKIIDTDEGPVHKMYSVNNSSYSMRNLRTLHSMNVSIGMTSQNILHKNSNSSNNTNNLSMNNMNVRDDILNTEEVANEIEGNQFACHSKKKIKNLFCLIKT